MIKKRFEECLAKIILEEVLPSRFYQLEIADKPDLQNITANIGIEVTTASSKEEKEKDHLFSQLVQKRGTAAKQARSKDRIRQLGGIYHEPGVMSSWVKYMDLSKVYAALKNKLEKLNGGGYRLFDNQHLFVTDINLVRSDKNPEICSKMQKIQEPFQIRFDSIFLYLFGGHLIEFDMKLGEARRFEIANYESLAKVANINAKGNKTFKQ